MDTELTPTARARGTRSMRNARHPEREGLERKGPAAFAAKTAAVARIPRPGMPPIPGPQ
jgi:hypothetical protein